LQTFLYSYAILVHILGKEVPAMKKILSIILIAVLSLFSLIGCGTEEVSPTGSDGSQCEVTLYANGGVFVIGGEESNLSVSSMDDGTTFAAGLGGEFDSITKEGAEFAGWTFYAVSDGEWIQEEATDLQNNQLCAPCGEYGYYLMSDYEVINENYTTDELMAYKCNGKNYYAIVNWK
jgi:hypothetical protein